MEAAWLKHGPHGADRHQAQPQSSRQRQVGLPAAMPRPHRTGHAGQWSASGDHRGHLQLHSGIDRSAQAGQRASEIRTRYRRRVWPRRPCRQTRKVNWDEWVGDYGLVRDLIAETYPDEFHDFNARMFTPGGFYRGNAARERIWKTKSGKAEFTVPDTSTSIGFARRAGPLSPLDHAQQRPVQHHDLRHERPASRHRRHARRSFS